MARLARLVMDETFRQRMRNAPSADALVELIMMNLESAGGPAP
jgi:mannitol/fructose-specific phosphotransferase system IIA component (Ntr-type)